MPASDLFNQQFSEDNLRSIFEERVSQTSTVGKDGVSPSAFGESLDTELPRAVAKIFARTYDFTNFKQKLILKGAGKPPREISIASVRDRVILRAITNILMVLFEDRKLQAPHVFIKEISDFINPLGDDYAFVQIDIKDFYPSINHDILMKRLRSRIRLPAMLRLIEQAIRTPTGKRIHGRYNERGVPQGLSISNILSAVYMTKFDELMHSKFTYFRYVDDIVVIFKLSNAKKSLNFISKNLSNIGLEGHELSADSKTKIVPLQEGIDYLGYNVRKDLISVRKSSYRRMIDNIMVVITSAKRTTIHQRVLTRLNVKITGCIFNGKRMGWTFFFSMTTDIAQLKRLDCFVARAWRAAGMEKFGKPKKFVKSYYEIKHNLGQTKYIPKFDDYTLDQKARLIADFEGRNFDDVRSWSEEQINRRFLRLVRKEVAELERDVTPFASGW